MKNKLLVLATILLSLTMLSVVNAASISLSQPTIYFSKAVNSSSITLTNTGATSLNLVFPASIDITNSAGTDSVTYSISSNTVVPNGTSTTVNLQLISGPNDWRNFKIGDIRSNTVLFKEVGNPSNNATLTVSVVNDFCKYGEVGDLEIYDIEDDTKDNEDEWIWHPLDAIKITVDEIYNGFDKDKNIRVEYALYGGNGRKVDFGDMDTYTTLSIRDEDDEDVFFEFQVPADVEDGTYTLFVKAFLKNDEDEGCTSTFGNAEYYKEVTIGREDDRAVVVDKNELPALEATCGEAVDMNIKVYNIGIEDEDKVLVNIYNKELGIDLSSVITDLREGYSDEVFFNFDIPTDATEKSYNFDVIIYYNYDDDNSRCNTETDLPCYDEDSLRDLDKTFTASVFVKGNCAGSVSEKDVSITAELITAEDEIRAGREVKIKVTYTNTGSQMTSFVAGLSGYEEWATILSIEPQSFTLVPSESKDVVFTLKVNSGVSGEQVFKVKALYDGNVKEKLVSLSIGSGFNFNLPGIFGENRLLLWVVIINVVLIILIIIVALKVARN
jgi:hypothetical protein